MSDGVFAILVGPQVEGRIVIVSDLFSVFLDLSVEAYGIGPTPVKRFLRF